MAKFDLLVGFDDECVVALTLTAVAEIQKDVCGSSPPLDFQSIFDTHNKSVWD